MENSLNIKIADTLFKISCNAYQPLRILEEHYRTFLSPFGPEPDLRISVILDEGWQVRAESPSYAKWNADTFSVKTQYFDAQIDFSKNTADVVQDPDCGIGGPVRILCSWVLMRKGGFLLHASSILNEERRHSYVFSGPSESGKTTIARLSRGKDTVLTDETTAVARCGDSYDAYATPFAGEYGPVKKNAGGPIKALFFIKKDARFWHNRLKSQEAARRLFCNSMMHTTDPVMTDILFTTLEHFVKTVECYEFSVKPEPGLWRYIGDNIG
jgi:hypothetical protein